MAVTVNQLEILVASGVAGLAGVPFLQRVAFALGAISQNVISEPASTPLHAQRVRLAEQIVNNPGQYIPQFAEQLVTQLPLSTTNMVTVNGVPNADVDTPDATLQSTVSSVFPDFLSQ